MANKIKIYLKGSGKALTVIATDDTHMHYVKSCFTNAVSKGIRQGLDLILDNGNPVTIDMGDIAAMEFQVAKVQVEPEVESDLEDVVEDNEVSKKPVEVKSKTTSKNGEIGEVINDKVGAPVMTSKNIQKRPQ